MTYGNLDLETQHSKKSNFGAYQTMALAFKALGIVFGDIGAAPMFVFPGIFTGPPSDEDVRGVVSLIVWSLTIISLIKYIFIVLRANDNGEGGAFALYSLLIRFLIINEFLRKFSPVLFWGRVSGLVLHCSHENSIIAFSDSGLSIGAEAPRSDDSTIVNYKVDRVPNFIERSKFIQNFLLIIVILGSSLLISDGMLTPAISVISAIEGFEKPLKNIISEETLDMFTIIVISLKTKSGILIILFFCQRFGTEKVASLFSPIVAIWFISLSVIGIINISERPEILEAIYPYYAIKYIIDKGISHLGGVLLVFVGSEAVFADLGHFNPRSIQISFPFFVYIPLLLAYLGQGASLIKDPSIFDTTFWSSIPNNLVIYWFMLILATLTSIIAAQAMITATFSLIYQSIQLDCFPRIKIVHTSKKMKGQIYLPEANYALMTLVVIICNIFRNSQNLSRVYGLAISMMMFITTILVSIVMHVVWRFNVGFPIMFLLIFGFVDGIILASNVGKAPTGAYFTLSVATVLFIIMGLWRWGTVHKFEYETLQSTKLNEIIEVMHHATPRTSLDKNEIGFEETKQSSKSLARMSIDSIKIADDDSIHFIETILQKNIRQQFGKKSKKIRILDNGIYIRRLPGIVLFYSDVSSCIPLSFTHFINHFPALPQIIIFISVHHVAIPHVSENDRLIVDKIGEYDGYYQVVTRYGYLEDVIQGEEFISKLVVKIQHSDRHSSEKLDLKELPVTYIFGKQIFHPKPNSSRLKRLMVNIYSFLAHNSRELHNSWYIPSENFIGVGMKIEI
ncbi:potassium transporter [Gigaspora margarita]|uniref:Potassium transporter n=1 Tax=Gigaspora margarita TaxID=4874 RepID=A0A8H4AMX2_GIGMA|nr:potassium transporter [Gigaspora margarita]